MSVPVAMEILEKRRGSETVAAPRSTLVDYDSEVHAILDREALEAYARRLRGGATSEAVRRRAERVERIAAVGDRALTAIASYEREAQRFWSGDALPEVLADDEGWNRMKDAEQIVVDALDELASASVSAIRYGGRWDWRYTGSEVEPTGLASQDEVFRASDLSGELYERMATTTEVRDLGATRSSFRPGEVTRVVNGLTEHLRREITELENSVDAGSSQLSVRAVLLRGTERLEVSIRPYTEVEGEGRLGKSKRVSMPNEEQMQQLRQGYEANERLAEAVESVRDLARDEEARRAALEEVRDAARAALQRAAARLEDRLREVVELDPQPTPEPADGDEAPAAAPPDPLAEVRTAAEALLRSVRVRLDAVRSFLDGVDGADPVDLLESAASVTGALGADDLEADRIRLREAIDDLPDTVSAEVREFLTDTRGIVEDEVAAFTSSLSEMPAGAAVGKLMAAIGELRTIARSRSFGDLVPGKVERRRFGVELAPAGLVDLARTRAEAGDELEVTYCVSVPVEEGGDDDAEPLEFERAELLDVRKFGWYTTYTAQLVFYTDLHGRPGSYQAAPAVAVNLHYRPDSWQSFFDVFAPALGIAVISPSLEDGTELAIGAQATLLNDFLQVGWAYDISVDDDPWIFYFGLDLISAFRMVE